MEIETLNGFKYWHCTSFA